MKIRVFLDTNFFMMPYQDGIDIFQEIKRLIEAPYELVTLSTVKDELTKLKETGRGKEKIAASVGLGLLEAKGVKVVDSKGEKKVDEELVELAGSGLDKAVVCTNDLELKRILRKNKIPIISMRGRNHLDFS